jgi:hypothetical protein
MKGEKLMIVPGTADGFIATIGPLRSLDVRKGVIFLISHHEDRRARLLIKNLGRQMPNSVIPEKLQAQVIPVQGVLQLRFGRRD